MLRPSVQPQWGIKLQRNKQCLFKQKQRHSDLIWSILKGENKNVHQLFKKELQNSP